MPTKTTTPTQEPVKPNLSAVETNTQPQAVDSKAVDSATQKRLDAAQKASLATQTGKLNVQPAAVDTTVTKT